MGDLCNVVPGYAFKSKDWQDTGVGVVENKKHKMLHNTIDIQDADCISSDILSPKLDKYQLITGDFLIAMTGATAWEGWKTPYKNSNDAQSTSC